MNIVSTGSLAETNISVSTELWKQPGWTDPQNLIDMIFKELSEKSSIVADDNTA